MKAVHTNSIHIKLAIFLFALVIISGCKKDEEKEIPVYETGTMTDVEGTVYRTIKIGNHWWMAENLKVKRYRDSSFIQQGSSDTLVWRQDTEGLYCGYDNNDGNAPQYGFLYNGYVISNAHNLAPAGWHIPSDEEWKELEKRLGMSASDADKSGWRGTHEGEKLKTADAEGWQLYGEVWPTNESGFLALAGGCRLPNGTPGQPGLHQTGFWWTQSGSLNEACYRYLDYKNANVFRGMCSKNYGFSVRCVKD